MKCPICGTIMTPCDEDYFFCSVCKAKWGRLAVQRFKLFKEREKAIDKKEG
jgi:hypothetical protein